jgi:hypothetical protein
LLEPWNQFGNGFEGCGQTALEVASIRPGVEARLKKRLASGISQLR